MHKFLLIPDTKKPQVKDFNNPDMYPSYTSIAETVGGNYGIPCGQLNNIVVLDYDLYKTSKNITLQDLINKHGDTLIVSTPRGGYHVYHKFEDRHKSWKGLTGLLEGILDIRTNGNYIVGWGSSTEDGHYNIVNGSFSNIKSMPDDVFNIINPNMFKSAQHLPIDCDDYTQLLTDKGFTNIKWLPDGYNFKCDQMGKGSTCILCNNEHRSNHFFIVKDEYECVWVKNHSNKCKRFKLKSELLFTEDEQTQIDNDNDIIDEEYIIKRRNFEKQVCMILNPLLYPCIEKDGSITLLNRNQLYERFTSLTLGTKNHSFIKSWLLDPMKKQYETIDFVPENCPPETYNLWKGYDVEKITPDGTGNIQPFIDLANQLTQNNTDYFIKWLAFLFKHPGSKPITSPVFTSVEGTGKNSFFDLIGKMMGKGLYYETSDADNHLFGRFATCIEKSKLLFIDEMESESGFKHQAKLKALITNERHTVEKKGINSYEVQNLAGIVFASNNATPVKIGNTDRRFFVYNPQKNLDQTFFDMWRKWITYPQNMRAVYDHLMGIDIENVNWINDRPLTETYVEMKYTALSSFTKWLDYLITESFPTSWVGRQVDGFVIYNNYRYFGHSNEKSHVQFGKEIKRLQEKEGLRGFTKLDNRSRRGALYEIDREEVFKWLKEKNYTTAKQLEPTIDPSFENDF